MILNEEERSQLARYEAFLALASEMIAPGTINQVAKLLDARFKYVSNVFCWRYLSLESVGSGSESNDSAASSDVFMIDGVRGDVSVASGNALQLADFERETWNASNAVFLDAAALARMRDKLPAIFQSPEITQLYVVPQWGRGRLEALFFTSTCGPPFDKFDIKFIGFTSLFFHRKVAYLRMEKRMTDDLIETLNHLRLTQDDMMESEKLAALGAMVAGVSHELNTPIANAQMVAGTLTDHLQKLDQMLNGNGLRRSDLLRWQGGALEMSGLIDRSLNRAASLIASFKQVSIDQTSERRRSFDLFDCVEDVLAALRAGLKGTPWVLDNGIPRGIECDSFPGPLGQVLTNLIQNAVLHAFDGRDHGRVLLAAMVRNGSVNLSVTDDGRGMDTATLARIFEPFFTTKLGRGGSGLGLAISYRIATTVLGGDLRAISAVGTGTRFVLRMPLKPPPAGA